MSNLNKFLVECRERLDAATPSPWHIGHVSQLDPEAESADIDGPQLQTVAHVFERADQGFIANAPSDLKLLLEIVERQSMALERYANPGRWESTTSESTFDGIGCGDFSIMKFAYGLAPRQVGGKAARDAQTDIDALIKKHRGGE